MACGEQLVYHGQKLTTVSQVLRKGVDVGGKWRHGSETTLGGSLFPVFCSFSGRKGVSIYHWEMMTITD